METATDFGTGLRAHLGLEDAEQAELTVIAEPEVIPARITADAAPGAVASDRHAPDALALEQLGLERERVLARRESTLAGRAGSMLAAAQALYDEVLGGGPPHNDDELARLRRRKSVA